MLTESYDSFIYNSSIGIHALSSQGIILFANLFELETLGYEVFLANSPYRRDK